MNSKLGKQSIVTIWATVIGGFISAMGGLNYGDSDHSIWITLPIALVLSAAAGLVVWRIQVRKARINAERQ